MCVCFSNILYIFCLIATCSGLLPILLKGEFEQTYKLAVNKSIEYIIEFNSSQSPYPSRVSVNSENSSKDAPLMVVVRQTKEVLSWQLPLLVDSNFGDVEFMDSNRTLCSDNVKSFTSQYVENAHVNLRENPIISISTPSEENVTFTVLVESEKEFFITPLLKYEVVVSPSQPRYYYYGFPQNISNNTKSNWETVVLEVDSTSDICMIVSIQNASCPIYDLNHDIKFEGYYETVNRKGGITISKEKFPNGFFVVFVAKPDDLDCDGEARFLDHNRTKTLSFTITPSISYDDYLVAVMVTLTCIVLFYIIFTTTFCYCLRRNFRIPAMAFVDDSDTHTVNDVTTPSTTTVHDLADAMSFDETEYDTIAEAEYDRELILGKPVIYLSDLARKDPRILKKKSYLYLWHVLTVALFYGLPVVQLVITYQKVLNETGNQDLCYYNFLCAHPLGFLSDFNHLFSNCGYVLFGLLFLILAHRRERLHSDMTFDRHYGIPQHYGMFYALGVALIMEGILSGSYHVCPNHSNFQFDSSFMYVMAVLSIVKLYQTRHPDINATAYATFGVLAVAIVLGMIGILEANLYFWIGFTVLHIIVCFSLTAQIYYLGLWKFDMGLPKRVFQVILHDFWAGPRHVLTPVHKGRMVLLILGNVWNWTLAGLGIYHHERDFATYLLAIFMSNTLLYFIFYIVMKLLHKERINFQALIYLALTALCASSAIYFFYHKSISWALTPAQSRQFNQTCKLWDFYDFHDIWHFLSATGMFFTFMVLLTLDDDLSHTLRSKIHVF